MACPFYLFITNVCHDSLFQNEYECFFEYLSLFFFFRGSEGGRGMKKKRKMLYPYLAVTILLFIILNRSNPNLDGPSKA